MYWEIHKVHLAFDSDETRRKLFEKYYFESSEEKKAPHLTSVEHKVLW